jgi:hypothetical protein
MHEYFSTMRRILVFSINCTFLESNEKQVNLQVLLNILALPVIVSSVFDSDLETNAMAKDIMSRVFTKVLGAILYRSLYVVNQISFLAKLPF